MDVQTVEQQRLFEWIQNEALKLLSVIFLQALDSWQPGQPRLIGSVWALPQHFPLPRTPCSGKGDAGGPRFSPPSWCGQARHGKHSVGTSVLPQPNAAV